MSTTKLNIGKIPISKGEYQEGTTYQRLNQVTMLGSTYQSKIDDNTSAPAQMGADGAVENINTDKWLCIAVGNVSAAKKVVYNNETSGLQAGNVQEAIDETNTKVSDLNAKLEETSIEENDISDLDLADEKGNVLARLSEGHIKTKNFDSRNVGIELETYEENIYFSVNVHTSNPFLGFHLAPTIQNEISDKDILDEDYCVLRLPKGHSNKAKPLKIVLFFHGSGEPVYKTNSLIVEHDVVKKIPATWFVANNYAVLAVNGLPYKYAMNNNLDYGRPVGNWMGIESAIKALSYVTKKYNISQDDIYVYGESQGGMSAMNFAENYRLGIKAICLDSPAISMKYSQCNIAGSLNNLKHFYGFNSVESYVKEKVIGLDPFIRNVDKEINFNELTISNNVFVGNEIEKIDERRFSVAPIKIFLGEKDSTTPPYVTQAYARQLQNGGCFCECNVYKNIGHCVDQSTEVKASFLYDDKKYNLSQPEIDMTIWFSRFGGNSLFNYNLQ